MAIDVIALLMQDHRRIEELLRNTHDQRTLAELRDDWEAHAAAEERVVYPYAEKLPNTEELVRTARQVHEMIHAALEDLVKLDPDGTEFSRTAEELKASVQSHFREEEDQLFGRIRDALTPKQLEEMAVDIQNEKLQMKVAS